MNAGFPFSLIRSYPHKYPYLHYITDPFSVWRTLPPAVNWLCNFHRSRTERPFPFNLNSTVDALLKTEFDRDCNEGAPHPLMSEAGINAVPARAPPA